MAAERTVEAYIAAQTGWQVDVLRQLQALVVEAAPDATASIKWGQPVFELNGPLCYLHAFKKHINFGFWRGTLLPDPDGLVQSGGARMGHIRIVGPTDVRQEPFKELVRAARRLNLERGDPTKGS